MSNAFCQKCTHFENCCDLCPKRGLNLMLFTSIIPYTNVTVGLKLLIVGTNVTTVFCVQKKIKSGLKLLLKETEEATHACMQASLGKKHLNIGRSMLLFCKFL